MKFCHHCAAPVVLRVPPADDRPRHVCDTCATVFYTNPKVVVGCVPLWQDKILLCRRAIEPRLGFWTLPAGFMENGESVQQAAARETLEEANARVEVTTLLGVISIPRISQVYMLFRARLLDPDFSPGAETLEARLVEEAQIPWPELAFPAIRKGLELFLTDRKAGRDDTHVADIAENP